MARAVNRYENVIERTIANWQRRERTMVDRIRGGPEPPFMAKITPAKMRALQEAALGGNQAAEETLLKVLQHTFEMKQATSGHGSDPGPSAEGGMPGPGGIPGGMPGPAGAG